MNTPQQPVPPDLVFKSGLYWRQSAFLGNKTVPVILTLAGGWLTLTTRTEQVFQVPLPQVAVKFSKLSTMFLTVAGKKYPIVGIGAGISPKFSEAQLQELANAHATATSRYAGSVPGLMQGSPLGGLAASVADFSRIRANIAPWKEIFGAHGL
ncbi:hypothetical protein CLV47_101404 [Antricoccus suffuscus]|uniref:Uncharacterized protein n=1 Tax=Antricoccus suffuscus TaxID=1629062 RepID=A0A2T1A7G4_9ACTN|nr:hypothetical protein [Antricoccus suffuscus]PRZ44278.1 hypothetical protein CLV47_101404 [Antricoccus suffuscus]